jgi:hypothetical protein
LISSLPHKHKMSPGLAAPQRLLLLSMHQLSQLLLQLQLLLLPVNLLLLVVAAVLLVVLQMVAAWWLLLLLAPFCMWPTYRPQSSSLQIAQWNSWGEPLLTTWMLMSSLQRKTHSSWVHCLIACKRAICQQQRRRLQVCAAPLGVRAAVPACGVGYGQHQQQEGVRIFALMLVASMWLLANCCGTTTTTTIANVLLLLL